MSPGNPTPPNNPPGGFFSSTVPVPSVSADAAPSLSASELPTPGSPAPSPGLVGSAGSDPSGRASHGKAVEREITARLEEIRQYAKYQNDFGDKATATRPVYPVCGYRLLKSIGVGTYGSVWQAHPEDDEGRLVAIKFFPRRQGSARELMTDTRHLKRLTNETGFVQLLDINPAGEWPYFVMTFAERSLQQEIDERGPLPVREAADLFGKLVRAVSHAHAKKPGVCHCDLKPSNVLLNEQHDPLLSDFGQSRLLDDRDRAALGTFFFMPPEQADLGKETPDSRWDVYAIGAILYQMVNPAKLPPRTEGWERTSSLTASKRLLVRLAGYREHLEKAPKPAAHRAAPGMDRRLADVVDRCLTLDPSRRFADAGAVLEALRARQRARRRSPIIWMGAVATLVVLGIAVWFGLYFRDMVVQDQRKKLTAQIKMGQKETAYITARLLEDKIYQRVNFLEQAVPKRGDTKAEAASEATGTAFGPVRNALAEAIDSLRKSNGQVPFPLLWLKKDRDPADKWLLKLAARASDERVFEERGLILTVNANGFGYFFSRAKRAPSTNGWAIRNPWFDRAEVEANAKNCSWQDWFNGKTAYTLKDKAEANKPHDATDHTHISIPYRSSTDGAWVLGVSQPIWGPHPNGGREEVLGLLCGGIDMEKELVGWMEEIGQERETETLGRSTLLVVNERGILVWSPEFRKVIKGDPARPEPQPTTDREQELEKIYQRLTQGTGWMTGGFQPDDAASRQGTLRDPWNLLRDDAPPKEEAIATYEPFYPLGRRDKGELPWHVIVEEPKSAALKPVNDLQDEMTHKGLSAGGIFLLVAGLLWGGVFWVLRRSEGSVDG